MGQVLVQLSVAIIIPAYNEEQAIQGTIEDYKQEFPEARIIVVDNASTDKTAEQAKAVLRPVQDQLFFEAKQGKGYAVRKALSRVSADIFILTDGDMTYPASEAKKCFRILLKERCDLVTGDRQSSGSYKSQNKRFGHNVGNHLLTRFISALSGQNFNDVLSGLRIISRPFARQIAISSDGFQLETELTILSAHLNCDVVELPISYLERPPGSVSKLRSFLDGRKIIIFALMNFLFYRPLACWTVISSLGLFFCAILMLRPFSDYFSFGELTMNYSGSFAAAGAILTSLGVAGFISILMHFTVRLSRQRQEASLLEAKREWNSKLDSCQPDV